MMCTGGSARNDGLSVVMADSEVLGFISLSPTYRANEALIANAQALLDQVKADMNLSQGGVTMFAMDVPNVPPQNVSVMIAQAGQTQRDDVKTMRTIGICHPAPNDPDNYSLENVIDPKGEAAFYLRSYENRKVANTDVGTITILQQPIHGTLSLQNEANYFGEGRFDYNNPGYAYLPEKGYVGNDKAVFLVEMAGVKVKVIYFFQAISGPIGDVDKLCGKKGYHWKISSTLDANGNSTLTAVDYLSPLTSDDANANRDAASVATSGSNVLGSVGADTVGVTLNIADLPNGAIGQTTGTSITLDNNAAGHGWFIDYTPWLNDEPGRLG